MSDFPNNTQPRPWDEVLVQYRARYERGPEGDDMHRVTVGANGGIEVPGDAIIEVLERADDPSKDDAGTLRREDHEETNGFSLWQATQDRSGRWYWLCVYSTAAGNRGETAYHEDVAGLPVVGATPWTPAWEAERAEVEHADCFPPEPPRPPLHVDNEAIVLGQYYAETARARREVSS